MKVLMVVNQLQEGGVEVLVGDLARGLRDLGLECRIAALYVSPSDHEDHGVPTFILGGAVSAATLPAACLWLWRLCRDERPDIVHSHGEAPDLICRMVCWFLKIPHVVTIHTERPWHWRPWVGTLVEKWSAPLTRKYIAVSQAVEAVLRNRIDIAPHRIQRIPNWVCEPHRTGTGHPMPEQGHPTVINVARLHAQKGQEVLLEAFESVRALWPKAVLWIVGNGPEEPRLRRLAGNGVVFLGYRRDIASLLRASDLFVLSSHWEGLPLSLLEAMAEGVPVVATRVGGIPEVLTPGRTGYLVPPSNPEALARAIQESLGNPSQTRAMAEEAQRQCRDRRSAAFEKHLSLYGEISGQETPGRTPAFQRRNTSLSTRAQSDQAVTELDRLRGSSATSKPPHQ